MANPNPSPETRWQPGRSGNPGGSSRKRRLAAGLLEKMETEGWDARLLAVALERAAGGDLGFWREVRDMIDGKIVPEPPEAAFDLATIAAGELYEADLAHEPEEPPAFRPPPPPLAPPRAFEPEPVLEPVRITHNDGRRGPRG